MGFAYFLSAKMAGYTAFCHWVVNRKVGSARDVPALPSILSLAESYPDPVATPASGNQIPSAIKAGAIRTLIGLAVGVTVGLGFWTIPYFSAHDTAGNILFFSLLVPVRVGEWWLLFRWIYGMRPFSEPSGLALIIWGIVVSFAMDAIGVVAAFVMPGGMWVC